jgi:hypothetical protein
MCNLSIVGQLFRIIFGLVLIALAYFGPQTSMLSIEWMHLWTLGWAGLFPLISGLAAFCPIYAVLGRSYQHHQK